MRGLSHLSSEPSSLHNLPAAMNRWLRRALTIPPRRMLLSVWLPLIGLAYFGSLTLAAAFCPQGYDWRRQAISKLLYPTYDPSFHYIASIGVAVAGLLMLPIGAYIREKLRHASPKIADAGSLAFTLGASGVLLAGLIVSHPAHGRAAYPHLHEIFARGAGAALGASVLLLWICAVKAYFTSEANQRLVKLTLFWSFIVVPALTCALLRMAAGAHLNWQNPLYAALQDRALWYLGFWEWIGSVAMFLFILTGLVFLPVDALWPGRNTAGE
jgi:hypothetical protein